MIMAIAMVIVVHVWWI